MHLPVAIEALDNALSAPPAPPRIANTDRLSVRISRLDRRRAAFCRGENSFDRVDADLAAAGYRRHLTPQHGVGQ